ncbi:hypothetical protein QZH41_018980 [Actinostola sp. cb2023]|nr:hypothetical protein QZH41_018980 [Actinostola sp. cb2023]
MSLSESYYAQSSSETDEKSSYIDEEDVGTVNTVIQPYQDEPLRVTYESDEDEVVDTDEDDDDRIPFATLEARYEKREPVSVWLLRAIAYRWLVRWLCGYMGWGNTRPLAACMYHNIRTRFVSNAPSGYVTAANRQ